MIPGAAEWLSALYTLACLRGKVSSGKARLSLSNVSIDITYISLQKLLLRASGLVVLVVSLQIGDLENVLDLVMVAGSCL